MSIRTYRIYTKSLAYELRKLGFRFMGTDINKNFPQYLVYLFEDTPALHAALVQLTHK